MQTYSDIIAREPTFSLDEALKGEWHGGDRFQTAVFNALSMMLPIGEQYIIDAVKRFRRAITDPTLAEDVRMLVAQESIHRHYHTAYNAVLVRHRGYSLEVLEAWMRANDQWANANLNPLEHLAVAVAYEHLTASIAHAAHVDDRWFARADPAIRGFWIWHSLEEIEHKSVAFDLFLYVGGDRHLLRLAMRGVTYRFFRILGRNLSIMFQTDRASSFKLWAKGLWFFFGRNGLIWPLRRDYLAFYRPDFRPSQRDDRATMDSAVRQLTRQGILTTTAT